MSFLGHIGQHAVPFVVQLQVHDVTHLSIGSEAVQCIISRHTKKYQTRMAISDATQRSVKWDQIISFVATFYEKKKGSGELSKKPYTVTVQTAAADKKRLPLPTSSAAAAGTALQLATEIDFAAFAMGDAVGKEIQRTFPLRDMLHKTTSTPAPMIRLTFKIAPVKKGMETAAAAEKGGATTIGSAFEPLGSSGDSDSALKQSRNTDHHRRGGSDSISALSQASPLQQRQQRNESMSSFPADESSPQIVNRPLRPTVRTDSEVPADASTAVATAPALALRHSNGASAAHTPLTPRRPSLSPSHAADEDIAARKQQRSGGTNVPTTPAAHTNTHTASNNNLSPALSPQQQQQQQQQRHNRYATLAENKSFAVDEELLMSLSPITSPQQHQQRQQQNDDVPAAATNAAAAATTAAAMGDSLPSSSAAAAPAPLAAGESFAAIAEEDVSPAFARPASASSTSSSAAATAAAAADDDDDSFADRHSELTVQDIMSPAFGFGGGSGAAAAGAADAHTRKHGRHISMFAHTADGESALQNILRPQQQQSTRASISKFFQSAAAAVTPHAAKKEGKEKEREKEKERKGSSSSMRNLFEAATEPVSTAVPVAATVMTQPQPQSPHTPSSHNRKSVSAAPAPVTAATAAKKKSRAASAADQQRPQQQQQLQHSSDDSDTDVGAVSVELDGPDAAAQAATAAATTAEEENEKQQQQLQPPSPHPALLSVNPSSSLQTRSSPPSPRPSSSSPSSSSAAATTTATTAAATPTATRSLLLPASASLSKSASASLTAALQLPSQQPRRSLSKSAASSLTAALTASGSFGSSFLSSTLAAGPSSSSSSSSPPSADADAAAEAGSLAAYRAAMRAKKAARAARAGGSGSGSGSSGDSASAAPSPYHSLQLNSASIAATKHLFANKTLPRSASKMIAAAAAAEKMHALASAAAAVSNSGSGNSSGSSSQQRSGASTPLNRTLGREDATAIAAAVAEKNADTATAAAADRALSPPADSTATTTATSRASSRSVSVPPSPRSTAATTTALTTTAAAAADAPSHPLLPSLTALSPAAAAQEQVFFSSTLPAVEALLDTLVFPELFDPSSSSSSSAATDAAINASAATTTSALRSSSSCHTHTHTHTRTGVSASPASPSDSRNSRSLREVWDGLKKGLTRSSGATVAAGAAATAGGSGSSGGRALAVPALQRRESRSLSASASASASAFAHSAAAAADAAATAPFATAAEAAAAFTAGIPNWCATAMRCLNQWRPFEVASFTPTAATAATAAEQSTSSDVHRVAPRSWVLSSLLSRLHQHLTYLCAFSAPGQRQHALAMFISVVTALIQLVDAYRHTPSAPAPVPAVAAAATVAAADVHTDSYSAVQYAFRSDEERFDWTSTACVPRAFSSPTTLTAMPQLPTDPSQRVAELARQKMRQIRSNTFSSNNSSGNVFTSSSPFSSSLLSRFPYSCSLSVSTYDWFLSHLRLLLQAAFQCLCELTLTELEAIDPPSILDTKNDRPTTAAATVAAAVNADSVGYEDTMDSVLRCYQNSLVSLLSARVPVLLIRSFFSTLFRALNLQLFNSVMGSAALMHIQAGMRLKIVVTNVQAWCVQPLAPPGPSPSPPPQTSAYADPSSPVLSAASPDPTVAFADLLALAPASASLEFEPLCVAELQQCQQLALLLLMDKRSLTLADVTAICPSLTPTSLYHLLLNYAPKQQLASPLQGARKRNASEEEAETVSEALLDDLVESVVMAKKENKSKMQQQQASAAAAATEADPEDDDAMREPASPKNTTVQSPFLQAAKVRLPRIPPKDAVATNMQSVLLSAAPIPPALQQNDAFAFLRKEDALRLPVLPTGVADAPLAAE